jgi:hypothetical protein
VLGHRLEDLFPAAFLPKGHALAVAIMSYNGRIEYGLLGDYDALPDIDVVAEGLESSLAELLDAAQEKRAGSVNGSRAGAGSPSVQANGGPVAILPPSGARRRRGPAADMRAKRSGRPGTPRERPQP